MLPQIIKLGLASVLLLSLSNCTHQNTRQLSPGYGESRVAKLRTFYVRKHADDSYNLDQDIVVQLQEMGYRASSGSAQLPAVKVDAVITYNDRWMWDMTMYMLSLDVQLREPGSDYNLASAKTVRTSLVRKSQREMVRETLTKLLKNS